MVFMFLCLTGSPTGTAAAVLVVPASCTRLVEAPVSHKEGDVLKHQDLKNHAPAWGPSCLMMLALCIMTGTW